MAEPVNGAADALARCPWCSSPLPAGEPTACPSCGATLTSTVEPQLPGVTTLDTEAILRARSAASRSRNRLLSFITGEVEAPESTGSTGESLAPPSVEVRREMLRLAIAAEVADLEAEVQSLATEAALESDGPLVAPGEAAGAAPFVEAEVAGDALPPEPVAEPATEPQTTGSGDAAADPAPDAPAPGR